jgi:hypothetical protein
VPCARAMTHEALLPVRPAVDHETGVKSTGLRSAQAQLQVPDTSVQASPSQTCRYSTRMSVKCTGATYAVVAFDGM